MGTLSFGLLMRPEQPWPPGPEEWKRDSFEALRESLNRIPTIEEYRAFLNNGGAYTWQ